MTDETRDQVWDFLRAKTVTAYGRAVPLHTFLRVFSGWSAHYGSPIRDDDETIAAVEAAGYSLVRGQREGDWLVKDLRLLPRDQENEASPHS